MQSKLTIESDFDNLRLVEEFIESVSGEIAIPDEAYGKVLVSVMEAVNNAIKHGNKGDNLKMVEVTLQHGDGLFVATVTDEGDGFRPGSVPDPTRPQNIEKISGRGVFIMRSLSDKIEFNCKGNSVTMTFNLDAG